MLLLLWICFWMTYSQHIWPSTQPTIACHFKKNENKSLIFHHRHHFFYLGFLLLVSHNFLNECNLNKTQKKLRVLLVDIKNHLQKWWCDEPKYPPSQSSCVFSSSLSTTALFWFGFYFLLFAADDVEAAQRMENHFRKWLLYFKTRF